MRLLRVELDRFRSRRAIALMILTGFLLVAAMVASTVWGSRPVSDTEIAGAKQAAAQEQAAIDSDYARCLDDPTSLFPEATTAHCQHGEADYRHYLSRATLSVDEELQDTGRTAIVLFFGLAVIIGATFAGADWATGSMSNQLIFRPRRLQVWLAKATSLVVGVVVVAAVALALLWGVYLAFEEARGLSHSDGFGTALAGQVSRGMALMAGGALGGFALTMLLRSTVGTLALLFAYAVGGEAVAATFPIQKVTQWSIPRNVAAWLDNGAEIYDETIDCPPGPGGCSRTYELSMMHGGIYLLGLLVLVVVVSLVLFRRRDIP